MIDGSHPEFENFVRAFWRRIEPYKNDFGRELPSKLPVQFRASMETALLQLYRPVVQQCSRCNGTGKIRTYFDAGDHFGAGTSPFSEWVDAQCPDCSR